jgi:NAD(P)H-flavin reductase
MIRKKKLKRTIDISGPGGNAFNLLGVAMGFAKQLGLDFAPIRAEMTSGDYENLIKVFDKYFGDVCDLER